MYTIEVRYPHVLVYKLLFVYKYLPDVTFSLILN